MRSVMRSTIIVPALVPVAFVAAVDLHAQAGQTAPAYPWAGQDAAVPHQAKVVPPNVPFTPRERSSRAATITTRRSMWRDTR
jgi:hypothetical protein